MKRLFDFVAAILLGLLLLPVIFIVALAIRLDSHGPAIFWSQRVGAQGKMFAMPKFRTMRVGTPQLATHLLTDGDTHLTRIGKFLRVSSGDELPQLWSVLRGDMSFVGPRPALFNQDDLIEMRNKTGVSELIPGITGWAQINGRDELSISDKVALEIEYANRQSLLFDIKILLRTVAKVFFREGISH